LCTVDGHLYPTFSEAARALGLFQNQNEAIIAMDDAIADFKSPGQLRFLFAHLVLEVVLLLKCGQNFCHHLIEDYVNFEHLPEAAGNETKLLFTISELLGENGKVTGAICTSSANGSFLTLLWRKLQHLHHSDQSFAELLIQWSTP
jgi:hypothetical protein